MQDYTRLSVSDLITILKCRSLPTDGSKDSLVSRLQASEADNKYSSSPEPLKPPVLKPTPAPIPHHLPNEMDDEYCLNWDDDDADDLDKVAPIVGIGMIPGPVAATQPAAPSPPKPAEPSESRPVSEERSSQESDSTTSSIEKVTKTGYKYKSVMATYYPDDPQAASEPPTPAVYTAPSMDPPRADNGVSPNTPTSPLPSATPALSPHKIYTMPNTLSNAPTPSIQTKDAVNPKTVVPVKEIDSSRKSPSATTSTSSSTLSTVPPTIKSDATLSTAMAPIPQNPPNTSNCSAATTNGVRTTKTGYTFKSIASLFPSSPTTPATTTALQTKKPTHPIPQAISTAPRTKQDEDAYRRTLRATRFGLHPQTPTKKSPPAGPSAAEKQNAEREKAAKALEELEMQKEREREAVRQRVTKRQRNEDEEDRRPENTHRHRRQGQYRSPNTNTNTNRAQNMSRATNTNNATNMNHAQNVNNSGGGGGGYRAAYGPRRRRN